MEALVLFHTSLKYEAIFRGNLKSIIIFIEENAEKRIILLQKILK